MEGSLLMLLSRPIFSWSVGERQSLFLSAQKKTLSILLTAHGLCCLVSVKLTQAEVICEEGPSIKKMPPDEPAMGKPAGHCLSDQCGRTHCGWVHLLWTHHWAGGPEFYMNAG